MITISKKYSFDSAHMLWRNDWEAGANAAIFGKCAREHGHTYELEVTITGSINSENGMILNYFDLDKIVKPMVDDDLDHRDLNRVFPDMLTTAENMVLRIGHAIRDAFPDDAPFSLYSVSLKETPKTSAVWYATV